jgi:hypothetical protein
MILDFAYGPYGFHTAHTVAVGQHRTSRGSEATRWQFMRRAAALCRNSTVYSLQTSLLEHITMFA